MESRPFASLTAGLLARKGAARPAMRRPLSGPLPVPTLPLSVQEDLGWNDMGEDRDDLGPVGVPSLAPQLDAAAAPAPSVPAEPASRAVPREQQARLAEALSAPRPASDAGSAGKAPAKNAPVDKARIAITPLPVRAPKKAPQAKPAATTSPAKARKGAVGALQPRQTKAAFTLRLDPDRHLRLRLACALSRNSAQQIVTQALDAFLSAQPDLDAFARQLAAGTSQKGRAKRPERPAEDS